MEIKITIDKPKWDPHPEKTKTENWNWRKCVMIEFENQTFIWMPTYKQLVDITLALNECERINKQNAKSKLCQR